MRRHASINHSKLSIHKLIIITRRQPFKRHDLQRIGRGTRPGAEPVVEDHALVGDVVAEVVVAHRGNLVGQVRELQVMGGDDAHAALAREGADVGAAAGEAFPVVGAAEYLVDEEEERQRIVGAGATTPWSAAAPRMSFT